VIQSHFAKTGIIPSNEILSKEFLLEAHQSAMKQAILDPIPMTADMLRNMYMSVILTKDDTKFISGEYVSAFFQGAQGNYAIMPISPTSAIRWSQRRSSRVQSVEDRKVQRVNEQIFAKSTYAIASVPDELRRLASEQDSS